MNMLQKKHKLFLILLALPAAFLNQGGQTLVPFPPKKRILMQLEED